MAATAVAAAAVGARGNPVDSAATPVDPGAAASRLCLDPGAFTPDFVHHNVCFERFDNVDERCDEAAFRP